MTIYLAKKITEFFIQCQVIKETDRDTYEYCFQVFLMNIINFGTIMLLGLVFKCIIETILFVIGFTVIRKQAGGYHSSTPFRCYLLSVANYIIFVSLLSLIPSSWANLMSLLIISLACIIIWLYAPVADKNKPFSIGEYERYKRNSRLIISILFVFNLCAFFIKIISIQVHMLSFDLGILFAAVSLFTSKLINKDTPSYNNLS
ncbi:MAG: accessory gene regulator B family protein [Clostridiales bacterium]|nr:accessory gene regulator B family protein [Clostridiales bacterium]